MYFKITMVSRQPEMVTKWLYNTATAAASKRYTNPLQSLIQCNPNLCIWHKKTKAISIPSAQSIGALIKDREYHNWDGSPLFQSEAVKYCISSQCRQGMQNSSVHLGASERQVQLGSKVALKSELGTNWYMSQLWLTPLFSPLTQKTGFVLWLVNCIGSF